MTHYGLQPGDVFRDPNTKFASPHLQHQQYQYQNQESKYGYGEVGSVEGGNMPRGYESTLESQNMAGFAARKFAIRKQEENRKRVEYEQKKRQDELNWKRAEEAYYFEQQQQQQQEQQHHHYHYHHHHQRQLRESDRDRDRSDKERKRREERRMADKQRRLEESQNQQQVLEKQRAEERWQQRSRAMASSSSPLIRSNEKPLSEINNSPRRPTLRELRGQSKSSSGSSLIHQSSFKFGDNDKSGQMSTSSSAAFSNNSAYSGLVKESSSTPCTLHEEDPDEDVTIQPDGFGGLMRVQRREPSPPAPRESILMLAKCADCGQRFPLDKLDGHSCISSSVFSHSAPVTPMDEHPPDIGPIATFRSPFLEKYAQLVENKASPLLCDTKLKTTDRSPYRTPLAPGSPDSNASDQGLTALSASFQVEEERRERLRHIQEQREAKKMQGRSPIPNQQQQQAVSNQNTFSPNMHSREPGSISSSSASSRLSSVFGGSSVNTRREGDFTPSTSVESVTAQHYNNKHSFGKGHRAKKSTLDLGGIENLLQDIHTDADENDGEEQNRTMKRTGLGISTGMAVTRSHEGRPSAAELKVRLQSNHSMKSRSKICHYCQKTFAKGQAMAEKDGRVYCIDDYAELFLEKCRKCSLPVRDVGFRSQDGALSGIYHRDCFSCFRCHQDFPDGSFYIYENAPYCAKHYHYLNGTTCHTCKEGIEGKCRQMETGERFHPRCLTCQYDNGKEFCKDILTDYYLIKEKRLCEWHYEKVQKYLDQKEGSSRSKAAYKRRTIVRNVEAKKGRA